MTQEKKEVHTEDREESLMSFENGDHSLITAPIVGLTLEEEVDRAEKSVELFNRIKIASLKATSPADWVLQDGRPYLMERGAQAIASLWGVDIQVVSVTQEWQSDSKGKYFMFIAKGRAHAKRLGRIIEDEGVCSQRDKFFGKVGGEWKALHEVDMANIRRKAVTSLYNRLIKRVTGMINVTIEDLQEARIDVKKLAKVEYTKDAQKAGQSLSDESLQKRKEIGKMCLELADGDTEGARRILKEATFFKTDSGEKFVESIADLKTEKWIASTHRKIKEAFDSRFGSEDQGFGGEEKKESTK